MPAPPPQQSQGDNSLAALWITVLIFAMLGIIWYSASEYIVRFVYQIKLFQAQLVSLFTDQINPTITLIKLSDPSSVSFQQMAEVSSQVGNYVRYPVILVLGVCGVMLFFKDIRLKFRRTYNMKTLAELEQENWPQIRPILKQDLISQDIEKGPWAMGMTPIQFAKKHELLQPEPVVVNQQTLKRKLKPNYSLNATKAKEIFIMQLGDFWHGHDLLNDHTRALFAVFAARLNRDRDGAAQLLARIARSVQNGIDDRLDFGGMDALIRKHFNTKIVQMIVNNHAYRLTVMASMLEKARNDGVISTADFLWLKPRDRVLWFMLNSVGRQTPFVEVAGPFAHWLAEKEFGGRIAVPMVDEAVKALEATIKETIISFDDNEQYTQSE